MAGGGNGPDMAYGSGGLRDGGAVAGSAGETAGTAGTWLLGATCPQAAAFGEVVGAEVLAAALARARDAHARTGHQVAEVHAGLQGRAGQTAASGDGLTSTSTSIAGSVR